MSLIKYLASISLAVITLPPLHSEPRCPGNIVSLTFHLVQGSRMIVPVVVNHTGPYEFVVDTGTRFTRVDPLLATELRLKTQGSIGVDGVGFSRDASFAYLDLLEAGSHSIANHPVVVEDLKPLRTDDRHIRGIIGGDFLRHFDVLMDYEHRMLCLDDTSVMQAAVKGSHIALVKPLQTPEEASITTRLLVPVHLSGFAGQRLLLALDSGTNALFLFKPAVYLAPRLLVAGHRDGYGADGVRREFSMLTQQSMQIGSLNIQHVSLAAPVEFEQNALTSTEDGLLATVLFRRVFVSYAGRFVVFDAW